MRNSGQRQPGSHVTHGRWSLRAWAGLTAVVLATYAGVPERCSADAPSTFAQWEGALYRPMAIPDTLTPTAPASRSHTHRPWLVGSVHVVGQAVFYGETQRIWGSSTGRFHLKDDWAHDQLGQNDELSHLFFGYTMTQEFSAEWLWAGMPPGKSRTYAAFESALILTAVEVLDAFNPRQGFGVGDLLAGYAGIAASVWTLSHPGGWDIKTSAKSDVIASQGRLFARTIEQSDNSIWWATYRPRLLWGAKQPLSLGVGHSTRRASDGLTPVRELHFGIGTTLPDMLRPFAPRAARYLGILDYYYFNLKLSATLR